MRDYYDVLELPVTATPEEVKAKYRQLVRVYHPDRFSNATDKGFAEEKLKELNEAYSALSALAKSYTGRAPNRPLPAPVVEPPLLDFGSLNPHARATARFQVRNAGAAAQAISLTLDNAQHWFTVTKGRQIAADEQAPIEYEVVANTDALTVGQRYQSWIEVNMDGIATRLNVALNVAERPPFGIALSRRSWAAILVTLLICVGVLVAPLLSLFLPYQQATALQFTMKPRAEAQSASSSTTSTQLTDQQISSASDQPSEGWTPIFSPDNRQIAFLSDQLGIGQVYVRDPQSGRLRQLTTTAESKSALAWSPDGARLAYIIEQEAGSAVQVADVTSGAVMTLPSPAATGRVQEFAWTEDSQSITFAYFVNNEVTHYRGSVEGSELEVVTGQIN